MSESQLKCEECGEPARYVISRRVTIYDLETDECVDHPLDAYEHDLMENVYCEACYEEAGYDS